MKASSCPSCGVPKLRLQVKAKHPYLEEKMRILTLFAIAAATAVGATLGAAQAESQNAPAELKSLKPHEVVEQVLNFRDRLALTKEQVAELNELHITVRDEKHQYSHAGGKPHVTKHQAMITRGQAYADAMAILTPEQRKQAVSLLTTLPETIKIPAGLKTGKPHEVVERILGERGKLALSEAQVQQLQELHVSIRDEKHQYSHAGGKPPVTKHQRMITREQAFADAMAVLSPEQRLRAVELFAGQAG
jgi:Spy/CpxP family protein refolding chaperone